MQGATIMDGAVTGPMVAGGLGAIDGDKLRTGRPQVTAHFLFAVVLAGGGNITHWAEPCLGGGIPVHVEVTR